RLRTSTPDVAVDISADVAAELDLAPGASVELAVRPDDIRILRTSEHELLVDPTEDSAARTPVPRAPG
ncbi:MAG: hypothetical protein ACK5IN_10250, partial [Microbacterium sp.]|uniref:hypothetical protein n=1 Tax=Microbacterium sp. TaxID=51671 RepID=UPI003A858306